ncbi:MAG: hypothetical protein KDB79_10625 [Acidobacteria bacterium]|nr:hypothetical protein [Acidobacteriota bacterium]
MNLVKEIEKELGDEWIANIYQKKIRSQRTRSHFLDIQESENTAEIKYSLLGIELKVRNKRFACPELSTARYLRVFARLGIREFALPYNIARISGVADELESSWQKMLLLLEKFSIDKTPQVRGRIRASLIKHLRQQINLIGAGPKMPEFDKTTKQRNN